MDILFLLIPVSLIFLCLAVWWFIWAVNHRQFEDLEKHGYDILFDEDRDPSNNNLGLSAKAQDKHE